MLKAAVLHVVIVDTVVSEVPANVDIHFHLWVTAVRQRVHMWSWVRHVVRQQRAFVEISSLIDALFS